MLLPLNNFLQFGSFIDYCLFYFKVYPQVNLPPKAHFMTHYEAQTRRNGTLINLWCVRYESKHHLAKLVSSVSCKLYMD